MRPTVIASSAALLFGMSMLTACIGTSPPTSFYVLDPVLNGTVDTTTPVVGVGPIRLATYLDRLPVVRRDGDGQLSIATFEMWAEPLDNAIGRVIALNLEATLGTASVVTMPWPPGVQIDYQVLVAVDRFEADATGMVSLICRWSLQTGKEHRDELVGKRCEYQGAGGQTAGGQTRTMNSLLGELSQDIATEIRVHLAQATD